MAAVRSLGLWMVVPLKDTITSSTCSAGLLGRAAGLHRDDQRPRRRGQVVLLLEAGVTGPTVTPM